MSAVGIGLVGEDGKDVMHFAEFGVVMMLFLVGLELEPALLWRCAWALTLCGSSAFVAIRLNERRKPFDSTTSDASKTGQAAPGRK